MKRPRQRPLIQLRVHYDGKQPLIEAYADVFTLMLQKQRQVKSSIRTFDSGETFHYDLSKNKRECDSNGS